ncbi:MAG: sce7725 family protein [Candidatus Margulisiibacteriota bacterium]
MYFPFLRGKQYEIIALKELAEKIATNKNIIPIIEPVKKNLSGLVSAIDVFKKAEMPFVIISNPQVGELSGKLSEIDHKLFKDALKNFRNFFVGFIVTNKTSLSEIRNFLSKHKADQVCLIHYKTFADVEGLKSLLQEFSNIAYNVFYEKNISRKYPQIFEGFNNISLNDGFTKENNADYPPEEYFSDRYDSFEVDGYKGFGDYLIVGNEYSATGGPAYAVAIHLTYLHDNEDIWVKHFVSIEKGSPVNNAGKFFEALGKLVRYVNANKAMFAFSDACKEFLDLHQTGHYPGLGYVKKLSMKHHIELISTLIPKRK